ncbi:MAG: hypothetical protein ACLFS7_03795 [Desulfosudaceae bacterium]
MFSPFNKKSASSRRCLVAAFFCFLTDMSITFITKKPFVNKIDGFVKSLYIVIPAKAGIQNYLILLDPGLRRGDAIREIPTFYESIKIDGLVKSPNAAKRLVILNNQSLARRGVLMKPDQT